MISATTSMSDAHNTVWDAIVVGAGPGGSISAIGLARAGIRTLLVDRGSFPRDKLCGGCLNGVALSHLRALDLGQQIEAIHPVRLNRFHIASRDTALTVSLHSGMALSRRSLDAALVEAAVDAGVDFLPNVSLHVEPSRPTDAFRQLAIATTSGPQTLRARVVVMATGLSSNLAVADSSLAVYSSPGSRIGVGTTTASFPDKFQPGTIYMAVSRAGYVGLTRIDGSLLNIAAALDVSTLRHVGPAAACEHILRESGLAVTAEMLSGDWRGTVGLTRRRSRSASHRLFLVGDAAGYVEPFTGEGMAWAIRGGRAVVPLVARSITAWNPSLIEEWARTLRREVLGRRQACHIVARLLRYPLLVRGLMRAFATMPGLGQVLVRRVNLGEWG